MIESASLERGLFRAGAVYPFLRKPIARMARIPVESLSAPATDGLRIFFNPHREVEEAAALHLVIHCLYRHLLLPERAIVPLWDLACDLSAEYLRTELFPGQAEAGLTRRLIADELPEEVDPRVAPQVYRALLDVHEDELEPLSERFCRDDHRYWHTPPGEALFDLPKGHVAPTAHEGAIPRYVEEGGISYGEWLGEALSALWPSEEELPGGQNRTGRYGLNPGSRQERMLLRSEGKYDFSRYLRRFSVTREELHLDLGSFDYIPYCYGLQRYGNLPLIEPLEYAESAKVEELVIAIDTSGSCTRPVVERFLGEIHNRLMRREHFFDQMNVHIIQCDAVVQSHQVIHSLEDWSRYTRDMVIKGRGGTNFTPVFKLVEQLQRRGELRHLKGLIYFTDGDGAYPRTPTPYETAFVFTTRKALSYDLPKWIIPLCLQGA